jgi:cell division protein FtsI (penicillin-binding protein 3)
VRSAPSSASAPPALAASDSSIDPAIQAIADEELDRTLREVASPAGVAVVLDPSTGQVLADAGRDHGAHADVARVHVYSPGSTMKVVTLAAALEAGLVSPSDSIDCGQGAITYDGKTLHDSHENLGVLTLPQAVAVSSNVATAKLFDRIGGDRLERELRALHFGAAPGGIPDHIDDHSFRGALTAIGENLTATPLQVAAAYVAIANGGSYIEPTFSAQGTPSRERVMKPETAHAVMAILDEVVNTEHGTGTLARIDGARVAGKTGTAETDLPGGGEGIYASFVGIVPEESPRFVILVGVESKDVREANGGQTAAPAFARIATRALAVARR